jgi:hypothetical protein
VTRDDDDNNNNNNNNNLVSPVFILTFVSYIIFICIMNQQMHNWSTIYYSALYYAAPTCFDTVSSSSGSS